MDTEGQVPYIKNGQFLGSINYDKDCRHSNSNNTGETCYEGCCDYYQCKDCGKRFLVECPD